MDKTTECLSRKRRQSGENKQTSSSKEAKNEDPVKETMTELERMSEDASVLFSYLPQEIWLLITRKVVDSETLNNLMGASPVFRNLLLSRRVEFLFPQVWQVLGLKVESEEIDIGETSSGYRRKSNAILKFRKVCKSWCQGVDKFYENLPDNYTMQLDKRIENDDETSEETRRFQTTGRRRHRYRVGEWMRGYTLYGGMTTAGQFMNHFDLTHYREGGNQRHPIINRSISISYKDGDRESLIFNLLEKYGRHFWHCDLTISDYFPTWTAFYTELKAMLQLLPNLKTLKLKCCPEYRQLMQIRNTLDPTNFNQQMMQIRNALDQMNNLPAAVPSEMDMHQLEQEIASHPLPKLLCLQFLSVKNFPSWIFNALVSTNNHISMLEVLRTRVLGGYDFYSFPMPNLKQLSVEYFCIGEFLKLNKPEINWSLEKIYLNLVPCVFIPRLQIFSLLETKWADTLINVAIFTPRARTSADDINIVDNGWSTTLNLPKVQLFLFSTQDISSLDFILPMKNLKFLHVALRNKKIQCKDALLEPLREIKENQVVQFVGYFNRFERSNIWELFPNLKTFTLANADKSSTISPFAYTRQHYENSANGRTQDLWYTD